MAPLTVPGGEGNLTTESLMGLALDLGCHLPLPLLKLQVFLEYVLWVHCAFLSLGKLLISGPLKEGPERQWCQPGPWCIGAPNKYSGSGCLFLADINSLLLTMFVSFHSSPSYSFTRPRSSPQGDVSQLLLVLDAGLHIQTTTLFPTGLRPLDIFVGC